MNQPTILVTGATGNVGRPLIAGLLAEGARVRALTRDPATAGLPPQAEVTGGDYAAPGVLAAAVHGAGAVFVNIGAVRDGLADLLTAARDAGVRTIVLLSSTTVRDESEQVHALGAQHKAAEDAIKASGLDWTILRCGGFATNTLAWAGSIRANGVVRAPYGQAATALVAEQDIAAAAVRVLLDPGHARQTYYLTGQESLTQIQQAAAIAAAIGRPVRFEELSPDAFRQYAAQRFPAPVVEDLLRNWARSVGRTADMAPDLEKLIGRAATSYARWATGHARAYRQHQPANAIRLGPRARRLIRAVARLVNPLVLRIAGRRHMPVLGVVHHRGRKTGRLYATPLGVRPAAGGGFVIPLTFSEASHWYQNIRAAGGCVITYQGADHAVAGPVLVDSVTAGPSYPRYERLALRLLGINEFVWLADAHDGSG